MYVTSFSLIQSGAVSQPQSRTQHCKAVSTESALFKLELFRNRKAELSTAKLIQPNQPYSNWSCVATAKQNSALQSCFNRISEGPEFQYTNPRKHPCTT
jgi:hypothetical protein